jgi:dipeptidyl-peptidase-4
MKHQYTRVILICTIALGFILPFNVKAQNKQEYSSLTDALRSGGYLYGSQGPESVNWTNGGNKYSFTRKP